MDKKSFKQLFFIQLNDIIVFMNIIHLQQMSIYEMRNIAHELGIKNLLQMTRQELISELLFHDKLKNFLNDIAKNIAIPAP